MQKSFIFGSLSLVCLFTASAIGLANPVLSDFHQKDKDQEFVIPNNETAPTVDLIVTKDSRRGWNLQTKTTNFRFAPEKVNQEGGFQEGHAHLYINGKMVTRIYSNWHYLKNLEPGQNKITVILNNNQHETLIYQGKKIEATKVIEVK